jgi:hypothetical protein
MAPVNVIESARRFTTAFLLFAGGLHDPAQSHPGAVTR